MVINKRSKLIQLMIVIPEEVKQAFDRAESDYLKDGYYDSCGVIGSAIKNGTPLPKGHWINDGGIIGCYYCSECGGYSASYDDAYCKHCGAKMEGENNGD